MSRDFTDAFNRGLNEENRDTRPLFFMELKHASLSTPIRVVNDLTDFSATTQNPIPYSYAGKTWEAFPYSLAYVTDTEREARAQLRLPNLDKRVGQAVLDLIEPVEVTMIMLSSDDFAKNGGGTAMVAASTPTVQEQWSGATLRNVEWDRDDLVADIMGLDLSREPWPYLRATPDVAPALFI